MRQLMFHTLTTSCLLASLLTTVPATAQQTLGIAARGSLIVEENKLPGATDWQLTRVRPTSGAVGLPWIEGIARGRASQAGSRSTSWSRPTPASRSRSRSSAWATTAGGGPVDDDARPVRGQGAADPEPGEKNLHECRWEPTTRPDHPRRLGQRRLPRPADDAAVIGRRALLAELRRLHRPRRPPGRHPLPVLGQHLAGLQPLARQLLDLHAPQGNQGPWADVSFDRPYGREAQYTGVVNDPLTVGSGEFLPVRVPAGLLAGAARATTSPIAPTATC